LFISQLTLSLLLLMLLMLSLLQLLWLLCRIAIEQQASLVPVLALGEALQLRNLYDIPALQQYTYKRLGFPGKRGMASALQILHLHSVPMVGLLTSSSVYSLLGVMFTDHLVEDCVLFGGLH
jgi:hypothetical protein